MNLKNKTPMPTFGEKAWIVPVGRVIDPKTRAPLPEGGRYRVLDQYWLRRAKDGAVVISAKPATLVKGEPDRAVAKKDAK